MAFDVPVGLSRGSCENKTEFFAPRRTFGDQNPGKNQVSREAVSRQISSKTAEFSGCERAVAISFLRQWLFSFDSADRFAYDEFRQMK